MLTAFGKFCRKLRIDSGELLKHMADKLKVTPSYLSAVEVGRRNVPAEWPKLIAQLYSLSVDQIKQMEESIQASKNHVKIDLDGVPIGDRNLVLTFAREFKDMDEDCKNQLMMLLKKK